MLPREEVKKKEVKKSQGSIFAVGNYMLKVNNRNTRTLSVKYV